jgi:hypothetical protein
MKEVFAKLLKALARLFDAFTMFADATNDLAKSVKNATEGIEVSSRSLIPSADEINAEASITALQSQIRLVEKLNELKLKLGNDANAIKAVDDKIEQIKKANQPK